LIRPSLFYEERRILTRFPYAAIVGVLLLLRILSSLPEQAIKVLKRGPIRIALGKVIAKALS
jgi:hypothetical protein